MAVDDLKLREKLSRNALSLIQVECGTDSFSYGTNWMKLTRFGRFFDIFLVSDIHWSVPFKWSDNLVILNGLFLCVKNELCLWPPFDSEVVQSELVLQGWFPRCRKIGGNNQTGRKVLPPALSCTFLKYQWFCRLNTQGFGSFPRFPFSCSPYNFLLEKIRVIITTPWSCAKNIPDVIAKVTS